MSPRVLGVALALFALMAAGHAADNLCFNGGFELASADQPPPGWAMWGAPVYKVPANYTRDTTNPHRGQACFRLFHPANTAGYIVSAPDKALHAEVGKMLQVSFWARTDKPGPSQFLFTAYETINPFADAPSPGGYALNVGTDWQQFSFTVYEGWDYFADRSKLILLTFIPTRDQALEKTLWIDDVVLTQEPTTKPGRMVDERSLKFAPLQHRLEQGEKLEFTVDASKPLRPATRDVGGISFHRVVGWTGQPYDKQGEYTLNPQVQDAIEALKLPLTRFYAVGEEPFGVEGALDRIVALAAKIGLPQEKTVLELETQSANSKLPPETWARAAKHCTDKGYRFLYWEVSNEPYIRREDSAFATPDDYAQHVKDVSAAIKQVQPGAQIGIAITDSQSWGNYLLKQAAGSYDFVVGHYYAAGNVHRRKFEAITLTDNFRVLERMLRVNALVKEYNPDRDVVQLDTEWGSHSAGPNGERADYVDRNGNIFGVLHRAVRLIYTAREGMLAGASAWQMLNRVNAQGFGILFQQEPEKRSMLYWLYYYFNRHVGAQALNTVGTAPYYTPAEGDDPTMKPGAYPGPMTPVLATLSADGKTVYVVIANGSWDQTVPCQIGWSHFTAVGSEAYVLSDSNPDGKPLLDSDDDFVKLLDPPTKPDGLTYDVPPHSVTFIRIEGK
ncbi:MAG: hypothetical protein KKI08_11235 [Armatimonadetes bacterium]|nr:hypothetical protein [Armatimonadota bacterium]